MIADAEDSLAGMGIAIGVVSVLVLVCCFLVLVICCGKVTQARLTQAKAHKEAVAEAARADEMQAPRFLGLRVGWKDNFDMVRTKISLMLPRGSVRRLFSVFLALGPSSNPGMDL